MRLALFDVDGTIITTGGAGVRALDVAFELVYGLKDGMRHVRPAGMTDPAIIREVLRRGLGMEEVPREEIDRFIEVYVANLDGELRRSGRVKVHPGIRELCVAMEEAGWAVGLATGNVERGARIKLGLDDLNRYFPFGGFGCDSEDRPTLVRRGIERAAEHHRAEFRPEEVLVIGDTPKDIQAARAAGVRVLSVATGPFSVDQLREHEPDHVFENLAGTLKVMEEIS